MSQKNSSPISETANILNFKDFQKKSQEKQVYVRWVQFFTQQPHDELLEALVHEHENDFPLRRSEHALDRLQHRAMVDVLEERAQTEFLKSFLKELRSQGA